MSPALMILCFVVGALTAFLLTRSSISQFKANAENERQRATSADVERQRLEVSLAAAMPEANRSAQLAIDVARLNGSITELAVRCSSLTTTVGERDGKVEEYRKQVQGLQEDLRKETDKAVQLGTENSALSSAMREREEALAQERKQLEGLRDQFKASFAELSENALRANSETFLDTAKRQLALQHQTADGDLAKRQDAITQLVKPLQDGLLAVSNVASEMESKRERTFGTLEEQLRQSALHSAEVARQASALKDALKRPSIRGRWGEVQLKNCIELAGMEEHCDVKFQTSSVSSENDRIRPDMEVYMPGGRRIVVDSKTPMEHFLQYIEASTDEDRNAALIRHARGVKNHVGDLAKIDYMQKVLGSPDFVVMFLPNESFLAMALEREPSLMQDALDCKVLIATPGTLIGLLKVVRYGWNEQKQSDSARKIAEVGAKLNTELTAFLLDFAKLGEALKTASEVYDRSVRRVDKQISKKSQELTALGAKSRKKLSKQEARLLDGRSSDDGDEESDAQAEEAGLDQSDDLSSEPTTLFAKP